MMVVGNGIMHSNHIGHMIVSFCFVFFLLLVYALQVICVIDDCPSILFTLFYFHINCTLLLSSNLISDFMSKYIS
ncbi:hypothetical protein F383_13442 [Gossypium arboreum]|uniref:Uncharacterized protein n=1 Tax=Gossypium arboreum TaxID=29729 RepID=A0A0B0MB33_GOSAR|nr:hypothetical protein F383_13442 [Gossypium arboreum]